MTSKVVAAALLAIAPAAQTTLEAPVETYVYTDGDPETDAGKALAETAREVERKLERRRKKFRIAETEGEAAVVVEILRLWEEEAAARSYQPMNTNDPNRAPIHEVFSIAKIQFAEIEVRVGEEVPARRTASRPGRRPQDVAEGVRMALELYLAELEP